MSARPDNPYVGPRAFRAGERLYGRDRETRQLRGLLVAERVVLLHSPSGAGKSSLIRAALAPMLRERRFEVLPVARVGAELEGEGNRYMRSLVATLGGEGADLAAYLASEPLAEGARARLLVVDQFEEVLKLDPIDTDAKAAFFMELGDAIGADPTLFVLLAIREDQMAGLESYANALPTRLKHRFRLDLLGRDAALAAIREPAALAGVPFEEAAAERLVDDLRMVRLQLPDGTTKAASGPYVEPVQLQVVCRRLWEGLAPGDTRIGMAAIEAVGDVDGALSGYYDAELRAALAGTGVLERDARRWFESQLITEHGIRAQVIRQEGSSGGLDNAVIEHLVDGHIVRSERRRGAVWYELSHDRMVTPVLESNARWRAVNQTALQRQAALWQAEGRPESLLWRQQALDEEASGLEIARLSEVEEAFYEASVAAAARDRARRKRVRLIVAIVVLGLPVVAFVIGALGKAELEQSVLRHKAAAEAAAAESARDKAAAAAELAEARADHARFAYAQVVLPRDPTLAAELLRHIAKPRAEDMWLNVALAALSRPLTAAIFAHGDWVHDADFHPSGAELASACHDGKVRVWDLQSGTLKKVLDPPGGPMSALRYSAEGQLVVGSVGGRLSLYAAGTLAKTIDVGAPIHWLDLDAQGERAFVATADGRAQVYRLDTGLPEGDPLAQGAPKPVAMALSRDQGRLVVADGPGAAKVLALPERRAVHALQSPESGVIVAAAISSQGDRVALADDAGDLRLWLLQGEAEPPESVVVGRHAGDVHSLEFSPDGRHLVSAGEGSEVRLWHARRGTETVQLRGHHHTSTTARFSNDGRWLLTTSLDGEVRIWDMESHAVDAAAAVDAPGSGADYAVAFSPDGATIVNGGEDGIARLWRVADGTLVRALPAAQGRLLAVDHGARHVAAATDSGQVLVWTLEGAQVLAVQAGGPCEDVAMSPDGALVAAACGPRAGVWEIATGALVAEAAHPGADPKEATLMQAVAFTGDGGQLVTGSSDACAYLFPLSRGAAGYALGTPRLLYRHRSVVYALDVDKGGALVATGSAHGLGRVVAVPSGALERRLFGHQGPIRALSFSADSDKVATGSDDGSARIWHTHGADEPLVLEGHVGPVRDVALSPSGDALATASEDGTTRLWTLDPERLHAILERRTLPCLDLTQRVRYLDESPEVALERSKACESGVGR